MKRIAALLLSGAMFFSMAVPVQGAEAAKFPDVSGHWAQETIGKWQEYGVANGDKQTGAFRPDDALTRAELATLLERIMGYQDKGSVRYTDVASNAWYAQDLSRLSTAGILTGYGDGTMRPTAPVTRQEAAVMLCRVFGIEAAGGTASFEDWDQVAAWAAGSVKALADKGVVQGYKGRFEPTQAVTRAQALAMLDKLAAGVVTQDGTWTQSAQGNLIVNAKNVTLKDLTVTGDLIVAEGVGDGDVILNNVTVKGDVILHGCGANSFHIQAGTSLEGRIIVTKTTTGLIRVVNESGETIPMVYVNDGVSGVTLEGNIGTVVVACDAPVRVRDGKVDSLSVTAANADVTVEAGSTVGRLDVGGKAADSNITVDGTVDTLVTNAPARVNNNGKISKAQAAADGLVLDGKKPSKVTVDKGVKKPVDSTGKEISTSGGSSGGGSSSSGSGSSGGGSSSGGTTAPITVSTVELQLMAPAFGNLPDTADELGVGYTTGTEWKNADGTAPSYRWNSNTFTANQAYMAIVTLTPNSGYTFASSVAVKVVDGEGKTYTPESVTAAGDKRVVTLKYAPTEDHDAVEKLTSSGPEFMMMNSESKISAVFQDNLLTDPATYTYQWYKSTSEEDIGTAVSGATGKEYTITSTDTQAEGTLYFTYKVTVTVNGKAREYTSPQWPVEVKPGNLDPNLIPKVQLSDPGVSWTFIDNQWYSRIDDTKYREYRDEGFSLKPSVAIHSVYDGDRRYEVIYDMEVTLKERSVITRLDGTVIGTAEHTLNSNEGYYPPKEGDIIFADDPYSTVHVYFEYVNEQHDDYYNHIDDYIVDSMIYGGTITVTPRIKNLEASGWVKLPDKSAVLEFDWEKSGEQDKILHVICAGSEVPQWNVPAAMDNSFGPASEEPLILDLTKGTVSFSVPQTLSGSDGTFMECDAIAWVDWIQSVYPDRDDWSDPHERKALDSAGRLTLSLNPDEYENWLSGSGVAGGNAYLRGGVSFYSTENLLDSNVLDMSDKTNVVFLYNYYFDSNSGKIIIENSQG